MNIFKTFDAILSSESTAVFRDPDIDLSGVKLKDSVSAVLALITKARNMNDLEPWLKSTENISGKDIFANAKNFVNQNREYFNKNFDLAKTELEDEITELLRKNEKRIFQDSKDGKLQKLHAYDYIFGENDRYIIHPDNKFKTETFILNVDKLAKKFYDVHGKPEESKLLEERIQNNAENKNWATAKDEEMYVKKGLYPLLSEQNKAHDIRKLLESLKSDGVISEDKELKESFKIVADLITNKDLLLMSSENKIIVLSRHPYDIEGSAHAGDSYLVKQSALIAFLCDQTDVNVRDPKGRCLLIPYVRKGEQINYKDPNWVLKIAKSTAEFNSAYKSVLNAFIEEKWNSHIKGKAFTQITSKVGES